jgi:putative membrane protein
LAPYIIAFLHHLMAFTLVAALAIEAVLLKEELTLSTARRVQIADMAYGASAGALIAIGALRVFVYEKGAQYYLHSTPFLIKIGTFLLVALLSIAPTVEFLSWSKQIRQGKLPAVDPARRDRLRMLIYAELVGVMIILLNAALMAKGVGYFG